ncbi:hypothetical protein GCM10009801_73210 [Streptomyces albiaxialis]|uniref:Uncharacterized protein n=1 Tax=Streptomyces albiaxialis TaxID=329523 RepID=A0ABP5IJX4_9ACTN
MIEIRLASIDYSAHDLAQARAAMNELLSTLDALVKAHPEGVWQPASSDALAQIAEADALVSLLYRSAGVARRPIRTADRNARRHLLDRTIHQQPRSA